MKYKNENFPSVAEICQAAREFVNKKRAGVWPEDDWFDIGRTWSVNIWEKEGGPRITVYPDRIDKQGYPRPTHVLVSISIRTVNHPYAVVEPIDIGFTVPASADLTAAAQNRAARSQSVYHKR